jgi:hypothetical protein
MTITRKNGKKRNTTKRNTTKRNTTKRNTTKRNTTNKKCIYTYEAKRIIRDIKALKNKHKTRKNKNI